MVGINVVIYVNSDIWDVFRITRDYCLSCDNTFTDFKSTLKKKSFGDVFIINKCSKNLDQCKCIQNDKLDVSEEDDANTNPNLDHGNDFQCKCVETRKDGNTNLSVFLQMNGYELSVLFFCLISSTIFRKRAIRNLKSLVKPRCLKSTPVIVSLIPPARDILDYEWARRMERLAYERMELNTTMSWLSTLGGAFSALGDVKSTCAGIAARISVHQFKIAIRLGDLLTVSRCKLYLALSLIQRGRLKVAKKIIYEQYMLVKEMPEEVKDTRLLRMCQGLWAKLKYAFKLKQKTERKSITIEP